MSENQSGCEQGATSNFNGDNYVRHTRPTLARHGFYACVAYVAIMESLHLIGLAFGATLPRAEIGIAGVLLSPTGAYMAMRTIDSFSTAGKSP